jgi:hypothetical protein
VNAVKTLMMVCGPTAPSAALRFSNPIDLFNFDFWHYDVRTSKHGAFMGGSDFVQWLATIPFSRRPFETAEHGGGTEETTLLPD